MTQTTHSDCRDAEQRGEDTDPTFGHQRLGLEFVAQETAHDVAGEAHDGEDQGVEVSVFFYVPWVSF